MGKSYFFIIMVFLFHNLLMSQSPSEIEGIKEIEEFAFQEITNMGEVIKMIIKSKKENDVPTLNLARDVFNDYFYRDVSSIYHEFNSVESRSYNPKDFVEKLLTFDNPVFTWRKIYRSLFEGRYSTTSDGEQRYSDIKEGIDIYFSTDRLRLITPSTIYFTMWKRTEDEPWIIAIHRIKPVEEDDLPKGSKKGNFDGDDCLDVDDNCPRQKGLKTNNCCPTDSIIPDDDENPLLADKDGDKVPDKLDECPDEWGPKKWNGCPTRTNKSTQFFTALIPTIGDYKVRVKDSGPHWLWLAGAATSSGIGAYYHIRYKNAFPKGIPPVAEFQGDLAEYNKAKFYKQNSLVFFGTTALILSLDAIETSIFYLASPKEEQKLSFKLRLEQDIFQQSPIPVLGISYKLSTGAKK